MPEIMSWISQGPFPTCFAACLQSFLLDKLSKNVEQSQIVLDPEVFQEGNLFHIGSQDPNKGEGSILLNQPNIKILNETIGERYGFVIIPLCTLTEANDPKQLLHDLISEAKDNETFFFSTRNPSGHVVRWDGEFGPDGELVIMDPSGQDTSWTVQETLKRDPNIMSLAPLRT